MKAAIAALAAAAAAGIWWFWSRRNEGMKAQLAQIMPHARPEDLADFAGPIADAMGRWEINTPQRKAAFLAQIAHESDELWHLRGGYRTERGEEYASGRAYEGRKDLGNTEPGDGVRFKGRGLIQVTGRANYEAAGAALGVDFVTSPELLNEPQHSANAAGHYWQSHGLNALADQDDFAAITRRINGGLSGYAQRQAFLERATDALAATAEA